MEIKNINTEIKQFLNDNFKKQFVYYNNKASIKIQLPNEISQPIIDFLQSQNIQFTISNPKYIVYKFLYFKNFTVIRIKK